MSTKIYNGCKLPLMNHKELMSFLQRTQIEIETKAKELYIKLFTEIAVKFFDGKSLLDQHNESSPYLRATSYMFEKTRNIKISQLRDPLYDFEFEVVIIPTESCLLAIYFTENEELEEIWKAQEEVSEFYYWNNADPPEHMTSDEWDERGEIWDEAIGYEPVCLAGYTYAFVINHRLSPIGEDIGKFTPSYKERVKRWTEELLEIDYFKNHDQLTNTHRDLREFVSWKKTKEGKALWKVKEKLVIDKLQVRVTQKDLLA